MNTDVVNSILETINKNHPYIQASCCKEVPKLKTVVDSKEKVYYPPEFNINIKSPTLEEAYKGFVTDSVARISAEIKTLTNYQKKYPFRYGHLQKWHLTYRPPLIKNSGSVVEILGKFSLSVLPDA